MSPGELPVVLGFGTVCGGLALGIVFNFGRLIERERCANLAEDIDIVFPEWVTIDPVIAEIAADRARMDIAAAIRGAA